MSADRDDSEAQSASHHIAQAMIGGRGATGKVPNQLRTMRICRFLGFRMRIQCFRAKRGVPVVGIFATVGLLMISAASGIGGVFLWARLSDRNEQQQRMFDFTQKQLEELYSPLLIIRNQVRALSELRARVAGEFNAHYESDKWKSELMPCYKEMLQIFREKFWLAEDSTRERFQKLIVFVEIWERALNRAIPVEVISWLNVCEAEIAPLYEDLEQTFRNLRAKTNGQVSSCSLAVAVLTSI